jgi:hypothetical protein
VEVDDAAALGLGDLDEGNTGAASQLAEADPDLAGEGETLPSHPAPSVSSESRSQPARDRTPALFWAGVR